MKSIPYPILNNMTIFFAINSEVFEEYFLTLASNSRGGKILFNTWIYYKDIWHWFLVGVIILDVFSFISSINATSSTLLEKDDFVVLLVELLVSVSDVDLYTGCGWNRQQGKKDQNHHRKRHPFVPSGGKRTGSLYFTREKEVSRSLGSAAILF